MVDKDLVIKNILCHSPSHIIIGYSGGIDSSVLLNICSSLEIPVIGIYINHNVHPNALMWQAHCEKTCQKHNIPFLSTLLNQAPKGESFEAWASTQRMRFFQESMKNYSNPLLLLGHHQDDQAETFLIQAIRGSGLAGLASMPYYKKLNIGAVLRPLLHYKKIEIEIFAQQNNINHIYDNSNEDIKYRRNLIRNEVIPILRQVNPNISETLSRSANICAQSNNILSKLIKEKLQDILSQNNNINISKLISLDEDIQKSILHFWFKQNTCISLKSKQVQDIYINVNKLANIWNIDINKQYRICIEYKQLLIKNNSETIDPINITKILNWLETKSNKQFNINELIIRNKQSKDKCKYPGRSKANKLKILFQELKIPASERSKSKIILSKGEIIAVYPFFVCDTDK